MAYLARWRMLLAADRLVHGDGIGRIARDLGYGFESAFGVAFRRIMEISPGQYPPLRYSSRSLILLERAVAPLSQGEGVVRVETSITTFRSPFNTFILVGPHDQCRAQLWPILFDRSCTSRHRF
jgi:AraC-like DNA-binding protein